MRNPFVFSLAFLTGVLLDAFALRPIGGTSIFFLVSILLVLLYQRKYEINTYPFVFIASFIGSIVYLIVFGYQAVIVQAGISSVFSVLIYSVSRMTSRQTQNANLQFKAL
ncbi:MAG TPA: hypothetical protein VND99_05125 [Candidatus Acidoferrales bacterium]|nr:hypothetical protein [Candidatus Acidoferrales bacterium]